jgi:hypothetical protein
VSSDARAIKKDEVKLGNASEVMTGLRDLIVHLHRGNDKQAESIVTHVDVYLKELLHSGADAQSLDMRRAQQTSFAIDEVRALLEQRDFKGAATAAKDAAKEWRDARP